MASKCGLTPQYAGLEQLQEDYADSGFTVVGLPCNQFMGQEPGTSEEIAEFCSATYGVSFPMTEKIEVNGDDRHEIYRALVTAPNEQGEAGDVTWNFEKFLVDGPARSSPGSAPASSPPTRPSSLPSRPSSPEQTHGRRSRIPDARGRCRHLTFSGEH